MPVLPDELADARQDVAPPRSSINQAQMAYPRTKEMAASFDRNPPAQIMCYPGLAEPGNVVGLAFYGQERDRGYGVWRNPRSAPHKLALGQSGVLKYACDRVEEEFRGHINDRPKQLEKGMTQRVFATRWGGCPGDC